jgi:hypothetical protein
MSATHDSPSCLPNGPGWDHAVRELAFQLEVFGGYWRDAANKLTVLLPRHPQQDEIPNTHDSLVNEQKTLSRVMQVLAGIQRHSWANLSITQQRELRGYLRQAIQETKKRIGSIPSELDRHDRAVSAMKRRLESMTPAQQQAMFGGGKAPGKGDGHSGRAIFDPAAPRLQFDPQTQVVTLDYVANQVENPKTFQLYKAIADCNGAPITRAELRQQHKGIRGDKTIPNLLKLLPAGLRNTIKSGPTGYWLKLPARQIRD